MTRNAGTAPLLNAPTRVLNNSEEEERDTVSHLFVYGTLMRDCSSLMGRQQRARLGNESQYIDVATVAGMLFDLGAFPALELGPRQPTGGMDRSTLQEPAEIDGTRQTKIRGRTQGTVVGEVVKLRNPARTLSWLDAYEDASPSQSTQRERLYRRTQIQAQLKSGTQLTAWVYEITIPPARWRRIRTGLWRSHNNRFSAPVRAKPINHHER